MEFNSYGSRHIKAFLKECLPYILFPVDQKKNITSLWVLPHIWWWLWMQARKPTARMHASEGREEKHLFFLLLNLFGRIMLRKAKKRSLFLAVFPTGLVINGQRSQHEYRTALLQCCGQGVYNAQYWTHIMPDFSEKDGKKCQLEQKLRCWTEPYFYTFSSQKLNIFALWQNVGSIIVRYRPLVHNTGPEYHYSVYPLDLA